MSSEKKKSDFRVLIAEDHAMVRDGIVTLIERTEGLAVCGTAPTSRGTLELVAKTHPDLVVMDYFLDDEADGALLVRELLSIQRGLRILVLSMHREDQIGERVLRAGAHGFICKRDTTEKLREAVQTILAGNLYFSPYLRALIVEREFGAQEASELTGLTHRELQVFRLFGASLPVREIASRLGVSTSTVAAHRENLKSKLNCQSAAELTARAERWLLRAGVDTSRPDI